jgi:hypothetical protein
LNQLELFNRRQIYVAFPVRVGETGPIMDRPGRETLRPLFARDRANAWMNISAFAGDLMVTI